LHRIIQGIRPPNYSAKLIQDVVDNKIIDGGSYIATSVSLVGKWMAVRTRLQGQYDLCVHLKKKQVNRLKRSRHLLQWFISRFSEFNLRSKTRIILPETEEKLQRLLQIYKEEQVFLLKFEEAIERLSAELSNLDEGIMDANRAIADARIKCSKLAKIQTDIQDEAASCDQW